MSDSTLRVSFILTLFYTPERPLETLYGRVRRVCDGREVPFAGPEEMLESLQTLLTLLPEESSIADVPGGQT